MSLLRTGPETLTVYPSKLGFDNSGNKKWLPWETGDPIVLVTGVQVDPVLSNSEALEGQIIADQVRAIFKALPEGLDMTWDRVGWNGKTWYTEGAPFNYRRGRKTSHFVVTLVRREG